MTALKDLLRTADLAVHDLDVLLDSAADFRRRPFGFVDLLLGKSAVLYFAKPSTRTRISFETAVARLGGAPIVVGPSELQLGRGETIEDTARVVSRYAAAFVIRTFADDDVRRFAAAASIPVVNALTDGHHPCQSLADMLTLQDRFGSLAGLPIAYVGGGNNVCHSLMEAGALAGCQVRVATPPQFAPDPEIVVASGAFLTDDPVLAVRGARAVYTDVWTSMGTPEDERAARRAAFRRFAVTPALMEHAADDAVFMHCLPAHRGEEVDAAVIDGPQSVVWDQAENRLHTSVALLMTLVEGLLVGSGSGSGSVGRAA